MATTSKITITLQQEQLSKIHALVAAAQAASVSGFVQHAVAIALDDAAGWQEMLNQALDETGGPLTAKEREWADGILSSSPKNKPLRKGRAA